MAPLSRSLPSTDERGCARFPKKNGGYWVGWLRLPCHIRMTASSLDATHRSLDQLEGHSGDYRCGSHEHRHKGTEGTATCTRRPPAARAHRLHVRLLRMHAARDHVAGARLVVVVVVVVVVAIALL